jgi:hypothetical protein
MSTRSNIGVLLEDGTVQRVYCHWDGYPEHNGKILVEHYNTEELAKELVSFGDISVLAKQIHPENYHSFDQPDKDATVFYGRDRFEKGTEPQTITMEEWENEPFTSCIQYYYLFKDGEWFFKNLYRKKSGWKLVKEELSVLNSA